MSRESSALSATGPVRLCPQARATLRPTAAPTPATGSWNGRHQAFAPLRTRQDRRSPEPPENPRSPRPLAAQPHVTAGVAAGAVED
ncbi:hypothetical protein [Microbispora sp. ATCC PTA-5024]|uniref:hypothetical protein n=1 Tax=Microbispora sp. ATCC PTA-5024 TaxID=316330 RepID=UPI0003DC6FBD|nr:hypothetical protein [Microbispora sp. ATCC PTA-5024]ETK34815.1 hypothetical protein MPTA5024_17425 [Microbispora sp. ATCC PTA-5024]